MTSPVLEDQILKTDALGRVKTPRQWREVLLDEFEMSKKGSGEQKGVMRKILNDA